MFMKLDTLLMHLLSFKSKLDALIYATLSQHDLQLWRPFQLIITTLVIKSNIDYTLFPSLNFLYGSAIIKTKIPNLTPN